MRDTFVEIADVRLLRRQPHIDVRGVIPMFVDGLKVIPLPGAPRDITTLEVQLNLTPDGQAWHGWFLKGASR